WRGRGVPDRVPLRFRRAPAGVAGFRRARGVAGARRAARRRAAARPVPDRAGELVHAAGAARRAAAALQDGRAHPGGDLPADHPGRARLGAADRALAAGSPARGDHGGDRVGDDLGRHAANDPAAAPVAVSRPALTAPVRTQGGLLMLANHPVDVMLLATDLGVARAFYGDTLGLPVLLEDEQLLPFGCGGGSRLVVTKSTTGTTDQ